MTGISKGTRYSGVPPGPYLQFLLRRGEVRGRRLAVLIPSLVYLGLAIYPLLEIVTRMLLFSYDPSRSELIGRSVLAGIGLIGALVNATVMWGMTGPTVTTSPFWNLGLTTPLLLMLVVVSLYIVAISDAGRLESYVRAVLLIMAAYVGYLRPNGTASFWPSYRPNLPQYHP